MVYCGFSDDALSISLNTVKVLCLKFADVMSLLKIFLTDTGTASRIAFKLSLLSKNAVAHASVKNVEILVNHVLTTLSKVCYFCYIYHSCVNHEL